jgi:hypothetical protein
MILISRKLSASTVFVSPETFPVGDFSLLTGARISCEVLV